MREVGARLSQAPGPHPVAERIRAGSRAPLLVGAAALLAAMIIWFAATVASSPEALESELRGGLATGSAGTAGEALHCVDEGERLVCYRVPDPDSIR